MSDTFSKYYCHFRLEAYIVLYLFLCIATAQKSLITGAMRRIEQATAINNRQCVRFQPKTETDQYSILIKTGTGCSSHVCNIIFKFGEKI